METHFLNKSKWQSPTVKLKIEPIVSLPPRNTPIAAIQKFKLWKIPLSTLWMDSIETVSNGPNPINMHVKKLESCIAVANSIHLCQEKTVGN